MTSVVGVNTAAKVHGQTRMLKLSDGGYMPHVVD